MMKIVTVVIPKWLNITSHKKWSTEKVYFAEEFKLQFLSVDTFQKVIVGLLKCHFGMTTPETISASHL